MGRIRRPGRFISDRGVDRRAAAAPGALDLANFERVQAKLRFGVEF
jgi:hypothetical protein